MNQTYRTVLCLLGVSVLIATTTGCTLTPKNSVLKSPSTSYSPTVAATKKTDTPLLIQPKSSITPATTTTNPNTTTTLIPSANRLGYVLAAPQETPLPPIDVWARISRGFRLPDEAKNHANVRSYIRWYSDKQDYINRFTERARPYLYYIIDAIEKRGMPTEIALLPVVESAFQPFAYSSGQAAGIWQFIPSTGKYFGLEQNWWYDGRRDVYRSTQAALNYLEKLNKEFDGDWLLSLAAYNMGENNLRRAIKRNKKLGKKTDFWSLKLPKETRGYVPKLLAISEVLRHAEKHGLRFKPIPNQPYWDKVTIDTQLDLAKAAEYAGVSIDEIQRLNPGLNRWATPPGAFDLMLPEDRVAAFQQAYALTTKEQRISWARHKVRRGETLSHIARDHHTTVKVLKEFNRLKSSRIHIGKALLVPIADQEMPQYSLSDAQRKLNLLNQYAPSHKRKLTHTVLSGDTLWDLSVRYKTSIKSLASWNKISPKDTLTIGQRLVIWKNKKRLPRTVTSSGLSHDKTIQKVTYTVRRGDSLAKISKKFRIKITQLRQWNSIGRSQNILHPGQKLTLYVDITQQSDS